MKFSERFNVSQQVIDEYGAINISLLCDLPLFIDPLLIFSSEKEDYKILHEEIIRYFHFLTKKSEKGLSDEEIKTWFSFNEIKENWLGYSISGNSGLGTGIKFSKVLAKNIKLIFENKGISKGVHIEKFMLFNKGNGQDKISDITVNLIKKYLLEYTVKFAENHIDKSLLKKINVEKAYFDYEKEYFVSKEYLLPYILNNKGKIEYILLTPKDILRVSEQEINRKNLLSNYEEVRDSIDNINLRVQLQNYIGIAVANYEEKMKREKPNAKINQNSLKKVEREAFEEALFEYPQILDYYIRMKEKVNIKDICLEETDYQVKKFSKNIDKIIEAISELYLKDKKIINSSYEEAKKRIKYFKHVIENCDGYKCFYNSKNDRDFSENDFQRMSKLVWYGTEHKIDAETNNGRGPADFVISYGEDDQCVIEFKLASNSKLNNVFNQIEIYKKANNTKKGIAVIFYFNDLEGIKTRKLINGLDLEESINENIFLIDCCIKESASKVKSSN